MILIWATRLGWRWHQVGLALAWTIVMIGACSPALPDRRLTAAGQMASLAARWLERRADHYLQIEQHAAAANSFTLALAFDPDNPRLYLQRGRTWLALYEWDRALADHNRALALLPDWDEAYFYRGLLYASVLQTGSQLHREALADFRRYLELSPDGRHAAAAARYLQDLEAALEALAP